MIDPYTVKVALFVVVALGGLGWFIHSLPTPSKRSIDVRGEQCEIHWKQTGITSTGAGIGHDEVICPSWSKQ